MPNKEEVNTTTSADENAEEMNTEKTATEENKTDSKEQPNGSETNTDDRKKQELVNRIRELEEENSSLKDQYLRKQADFENFRKRMQREKQDAIQFANSNLLLDLVTIIDDFERAIKAGEDSEDIESFRQGIELIEKQLTGMLERKWGLKRFDSEGEEFDPQRHEAVMTEDVPGQDRAIVLEDYQKGYFLHDKVLRSAKVKVSMPAPEPETERE